MESNEKTNLITSHVYPNYSSKPHHLHYTSTISRVVSIIKSWIKIFFYKIKINKYYYIPTYTLTHYLFNY